MAQPSLSFGIVPQQSASKLAKLWGPIIKEISQKSGIAIHFATAPIIPSFEKRLAEGEYDIAYMNPYHYITFNKLVGYQALAKARDKQIRGIVVVANDNPLDSLEGLNNSSLAFPAPGAFAATMLIQSALAEKQINFTPQYVYSHDSVYRSVARGIYPAGGGIVRTFNNVAAEIRAQLRILWTTGGYTPHAFAAHPRVKADDVHKLQQALTEMDQQLTGKDLLRSIKIKGFVTAVDSDWDDIRALKINPHTDK